MKLGMANWEGTQAAESALDVSQLDLASQHRAAGSAEVAESAMAQSAANGPSNHAASPTEARRSRLGNVDPDVARVIESQFPGLEVVELLGQGGMGMVFKARQTSLDRHVALKVINAKSELKDAFEVRFSREAKALASLNHPDIVTVHDFGKSDDYFYLIMEYVDGVNLRDLLEGQKISAREALEIIPQICDALQYAHDQGVVHRDIKPENILIDKNGRVKLADYGLAKLVKGETSGPNLTRTHHVMGTPHYMAPEQVEKPLTVDHRADIYSLGVVIYEMLTGELPLGRFALPSEKGEVDSRLDKIVMQSLEKEPGLRYQKVSEVKTDFQTAMKPDQRSSAASQLQPSEMPPPDQQRFPENAGQHAYTGQHQAPQRPVPEPPLGRPLEHQRVGHQKAVPEPLPRTAAAPAKPKLGKNANPYEGRDKSKGFAGMFSIQSYLNAAYLMLSFPIGLVCFLLAVIGVSAGIPLTIIWIGFFVLYGSFSALQIMFSLERALCRWLLKEEIYYRSPASDESTRLKKFTALITNRSTWWGVCYALIKFPWSVICFTLTLVFFTVPLFLFAAPVLFTQWWFDMDFGGFEVNTLERAIAVSILGIPIFYVGVQLTNGLAYVSKKMSKFFLSRY